MACRPTVDTRQAQTQFPFLTPPSAVILISQVRARKCESQNGSAHGQRAVEKYFSHSLVLMHEPTLNISGLAAEASIATACRQMCQESIHIRLSTRSNLPVRVHLSAFIVLLFTGVGLKAGLSDGLPVLNPALAL